MNIKFCVPIFELLLYAVRRANIPSKCCNVGAIKYHTMFLHEYPNSPIFILMQSSPTRNKSSLSKRLIFNAYKARNILRLINLTLILEAKFWHKQISTGYHAHQIISGVPSILPLKSAENVANVKIGYESKASVIREGRWKRFLTIHNHVPMRPWVPRGRWHWRAQMEEGREKKQRNACS